MGKSQPRAGSSFFPEPCSKDVHSSVPSSGGQQSTRTLPETQFLPKSVAKVSHELKDLVETGPQLSDLFFQIARGSFLVSLNQWQNSHPAQGKQELLPSWALPAGACSSQALPKGRTVPFSCSARDQETPLACLVQQGLWKAGASDFKGALSQQDHR